MFYVLYCSVYGERTKTGPPPKKRRKTTKSKTVAKRIPEQTGELCFQNKLLCNFVKTFDIQFLTLTEVKPKRKSVAPKKSVVKKPKPEHLDEESNKKSELKDEVPKKRGSARIPRKPPPTIAETVDNDRAPDSPEKTDSVEIPSPMDMIDVSHEEKVPCRPSDGSEINITETADRIPKRGPTAKEVFEINADINVEIDRAEVEVNHGMVDDSKMTHPECNDQSTMGSESQIFQNYGTSDEKLDETDLPSPMTDTDIDLVGSFEDNDKGLERTKDDGQTRSLSSRGLNDLKNDIKRHVSAQSDERVYSSLDERL